MKAAKYILTSNAAWFLTVFFGVGAAARGAVGDIVFNFGEGHVLTRTFGPTPTVEYRYDVGSEPFNSYVRSADATSISNGSGGNGVGFGSAIAEATVRLSFDIPKQGGFLLEGRGSGIADTSSHGVRHPNLPTYWYSGPSASAQSESYGLQSYRIQNALYYFDMRATLYDPGASIFFGNETFKGSGASKTVSRAGIIDTRNGNVVANGIQGVLTKRAFSATGGDISDQAQSGRAAWDYSVFLFPLIDHGDLPTGDARLFPLLPSIFSPGGFGKDTVGFEFTPKLDKLFYLDPSVVEGYEFFASGRQMFEAIELPVMGDNRYDLQIWNAATGEFYTFSESIFGGTKVDLPFDTSRLRVTGIEGTGEFVTGFEFLYQEPTTVYQTPLYENGGFVPVPEPSTWGAVSVTLVLGLCALRMLRSRSTSSS